MATLVLSAAGAAFGGAVGGSVLGVASTAIGQAIGATIGAGLDQKLLGGGSEPVATGRVETFRLQGASEGAPMARVFGKIRVPAQVIWTTNFREHRNASGGGGGKAPTPEVVEYGYSVSLALGLCEGEIQDIGTIWADGNRLSLKNVAWRLHHGTEDQLPDPLIMAVEGSENAPAYRGTAYLVLENLDLAPFGNRVPNFNVEVIRRPKDTQGSAEVDPFDAIQAVALMPGTGEYALATTPVRYDYGKLSSRHINVNHDGGGTDLDRSMSQLGTELPNAKSVALIVSWFGDDLRVGKCRIEPRVEQTEFDGAEMAWSVSGVEREGASTVSTIDGRPNYGGTPSDASVVEAIRRIQADGREVMFYPFILMDVTPDNELPDPWSGSVGQPAFPWRGRITLDQAPGQIGSVDQTHLAGNDVRAFFGNAAVEDFALSADRVVYSGPEEWTLRRFILHSAWLCKLAGGVEAFCIGSELRSLTQIRDGRDSFPAVRELVRLAADVRAILGRRTRISYAADWSEYFGYHPNDGTGDHFFHLDDLWASDDINFIGIDNYMPLSDWRDGSTHKDADYSSIYDLSYLVGNLAGGEGYDWYYADQEARDAQARAPIRDTAYGEDWVFRYKDLKRWWSRPHYNRINGIKQPLKTAWNPKSKPFWFTELGCAAIDKGTNQPNVFLDVKSSESATPYYSTGERDDLIQFRYLQAHFIHWANEENNPVSAIYGGRMVDMSRAHVWAWDARPYPEFPNRLDVWSDGTNYGRGHWITGRTALASLAGIVAELSERSGVTDYDVSGLYGAVQGFSVAATESARQSIQPLMLAHAFDAAEAGGVLSYKSRTASPDVELDADAMVLDRGQSAPKFVRGPKGDVPGQVQVNYYRLDADYQRSAVTEGDGLADDANVSIADLPLAMTDDEAKQIAARWMAESAVARDETTIELPMSYMAVTPGDVVSLADANGVSTYRVDRIEDGTRRRVSCSRVERGVYQPARTVDAGSIPLSYTLPGPSHIEFLKLPLLDAGASPFVPHLAAIGAPWTGALGVYTSLTSDGFQRSTDIQAPATIGEVIAQFENSDPALWSFGAALRVRLLNGTLSSASREAVLNGANLAAIRAPGSSGPWELIQFQRAELVGEREYELGGLLRGQFGTAPFVPSSYPAGSDFVLINESLVQPAFSDSARGLLWNFRIGPASRSYGDESYRSFAEVVDSDGLRPYAPVHLRAMRLENGDRYFRWIRQTRVGGDSWEGFDVPLGEERELYQIRILHDGRVLRTVEVPIPSYRYTEEDMAQDGFALPCEIEVAQISEAYGLGPKRRISVDV